MTSHIALSELLNGFESVGAQDDRRVQAARSSEYAHGVHDYGRAIPTLLSIRYQDERPEQE